MHARDAAAFDKRKNRHLWRFAAWPIGEIGTQGLVMESKANNRGSGAVPRRDSA